MAEQRNSSTTLAWERHMIFVCPECGQTFSTQLEWRKHLNSVHGYTKKKAKDFDFIEIDNRYHECQICLKRLAHAHHSPVLLQYHRFTHLAYGGPFRCRYCAGSYAKKRALSVHLFRCHYQQMNKIDNEYKMMKLKQGIALRHPRFNKDFFIRFICPQCGKVFQRFREWQQHINSAHTCTKKSLCMHRIICSRDYYCDQCSDTLKNGPSPEQLRRHQFSHLTHTAYFQCVYCATRKAYKTDLFLHFIKQHRADYLKNKKYILCPEEWGGPAKKDTLEEIEIFTNSDEMIVLDIRRHNRESEVNNIPTEEADNNIRTVYPHGKLEADSTNGNIVHEQDIAPSKGYSLSKDGTEPQKSKDILQKALRDSCINFEEDLTEESVIRNNSIRNENVFVVEAKPTISNELNDKELELICEEIFEEIPDCNYNENKKSVREVKPLNNGINNEILKREMQKYINYLCPECLREFNNQPNWRTHVFEQHNLTKAVKSKFRPLNPQKTAYLCMSCVQIQRTSKHVDLQRHYFQHMPHQSYLKCKLCFKTKSSKPKMLHHLESVHDLKIQQTATKTLQCLQCDNIVEDPLQLKNHLQVCPKRLQPLLVKGQYDNIAKNLKLLRHLQNASKRIDQMWAEDSLDGKSRKS